MAAESMKNNIRVARWFIFKPNLGKFCRVLQWKLLVHFMAVTSILRPYGIFWSFGIFSCHLVYFSCFGIFYQEKSGNPEQYPSFNFWRENGRFFRR
jgi:hypothetical protein